MSVTPINVAAALFLERQASGAELMAPITGILEPDIEALLLSLSAHVK